MLQKLISLGVIFTLLTMINKGVLITYGRNRLHLCCIQLIEDVHIHLKRQIWLPKGLILYYQCQ